MVCKGICLKHKAKKEFGGGWYENGAKRCNICSLFLMWSELRCPCCNNLLKVKPIARKWKQDLKKVQLKKGNIRNVNN